VVSQAHRLPFVVEGLNLQVRTAAGIVEIADFLAVKCLLGI
jgi:hypothetical protein